MTRKEALDELEDLNEGCYFCGSIEKLLAEVYDHFEQQIAQQEAQLNALADKIYLQAQHIELLESPKTCSGCAYGDADSCTKLHFVLPHRPELFSCNYYEPKETK